MPYCDPLFRLFLVPVPLPVILVIPSVEGLGFASGKSPSLFAPVPLPVWTILFAAFLFLAACIFLNSSPGPICRIVINFDCAGSSPRVYSYLGHTLSETALYLSSLVFSRPLSLISNNKIKPSNLEFLS